MDAGELDLCGRCLVIPNATSYVRAVFPNGAKVIFREHTDPVALKKWVEARAYGDGCTFECDATTARFLPISTWHGDPVCAFHLWLLADLEMKRGYRA